jgi:hypothetical protein
MPLRLRREGGASLYGRLRPPRGKTYITTIRATMITAAMATIATVEAATNTLFLLFR